MAVTPEHRAFVEAGIGIVMSMIMADGQYSEAEFAWFKTAQDRHPLFRDVPADAFNTMLHRVKVRLTREPWRALIDQWAAAVPEQFRVPVLEMAAEVAVVDQELKGLESDVVQYLGAALQISEDVVREVFMKRIQDM
jgi:uncharacterized tellurite resistance protein B-like protein